MAQIVSALEGRNDHWATQVTCLWVQLQLTETFSPAAHGMSLSQLPMVVGIPGA